MITDVKGVVETGFAPAPLPVPCTCTAIHFADRFGRQLTSTTNFWLAVLFDSARFSKGLIATQVLNRHITKLKFFRALIEQRDCAAEYKPKHYVPWAPAHIVHMLNLLQIELRSLRYPEGRQTLSRRLRQMCCYKLPAEDLHFGLLGLPARLNQVLTV